MRHYAPTAAHPKRPKQRGVHVPTGLLSPKALFTLSLNFTSILTAVEFFAAPPSPRANSLFEFSVFGKGPVGFSLGDQEAARLPPSRAVCARVEGHRLGGSAAAVTCHCPRGASREARTSRLTHHRDRNSSHAVEGKLNSH